MNVKIIIPVLLIPLFMSLLLVACTEPKKSIPETPLSIVVKPPITKKIAAELALTVYKTPSCGCCKKWISNIEQQGITTEAKDYNDITSIKMQLGIKPNHFSCHTAVSEQGFVFEGHIPAKYIKQFLSESHPDAIGLTVPGMPLGSPGMEVGDKFMSYNVIMMMKDGNSKVYAEVTQANMQ